MHEFYINVSILLQEGNTNRESSEGAITAEITQEICYCIFKIHRACRQREAILHERARGPTKGKLVLNRKFQNSVKS